MSRIVTFYSYKGGVGRTFAIANIAVLLARRGKRVLLMDWDLEAPGLHRYFNAYLPEDLMPNQGVIQLLGQAMEDPKIRWEPFVAEVRIEDSPSLYIIPSGDQSANYVEQVRAFSWTNFFENRQGGVVLERWRTEWKKAFDFVLVDSRTGITDTGGVCTVFLPDILVFVFSTNEQSFGRGIQVMLGVQESRQKLAIPRHPATILPLPGRFDGRDEVDEAKGWLERFGRELKPFYDDWLPKRFEPRQILELTKVPYVAKFSFGEPLPVLSHGVSDPEFPGFYLENVARLLASDFQDVKYILAPEEVEGRLGIAEFRASLAQVPIDEVAVNQTLTLIENELGESAALSELLNEAGVTLLRQGRFDSAETCFRRALAISEGELSSDHPSAVSSLNHLAELLRLTNRPLEAEELYRRALEPLEHVTNPGDPALTSAYNNLAAILRETGRLVEAEDVYRQVLDRLEMTRPGDPALISIYNNLAAILRETGRLVEAEDVYRQVLDRLEMTRPGDPALISIYNNLAAVLQQTGRLAEAEDVYRQALDRLEMTRSGAPALASLYNNLAAILRETGRLAEAEDVYRQALDRLEMARSGAPALASLYNNLAAILRETGRLAEAEDVYRQALDRLEMAQPGHLALANIYNNLAAILRETGRLTAADALLRRMLRSMRRTGVPRDRATQDQIILSLQRQGLPLREIARELKMSERSVRMRLTQANRWLAEEIKKRKGAVPRK